MPSASQKFLKLREYAFIQDGRLKATDPRFNNKVHIVKDDGSVFILMHAFIEEKDGWVIVYSEHHSVEFFNKEDLIVCQESVHKKLKHFAIGDAG